MHSVLLEGAQGEVTSASPQKGKLTSTGGSNAAVCTPLSIPLLHTCILHHHKVSVEEQKISFIY